MVIGWVHVILVTGTFNRIVEIIDSCRFMISYCLFSVRCCVPFIIFFSPSASISCCLRGIFWRIGTVDIRRNVLNCNVIDRFLAICQQICQMVILEHSCDNPKESIYSESKSIQSLVVSHLIRDYIVVFLSYIGIDSLSE